MAARAASAADRRGARARGRDGDCSDRRARATQDDSAGFGMMTLGFVGTGTIAAPIVDGLCSVRPETPIVVSPRNAATAAALAARHGNVRVAKSNQEVLDTSDMVVLAVRPQVAEE